MRSCRHKNKNFACFHLSLRKKFYHAPADFGRDCFQKEDAMQNMQEVWSQKRINDQNELVQQTSKLTFGKISRANTRCLCSSVEAPIILVIFAKLQTQRPSRHDQGSRLHDRPGRIYMIKTSELPARIHNSESSGTHTNSESAMHHPPTHINIHQVRSFSMKIPAFINLINSGH